MINLETRKKLEKETKNINEFCDYACFDDESSCTGKFCEECEHFLPTPTLKELIDAIDEKVNDTWDIMREHKPKGWSVWLHGIRFRNIDLDNCLAKALVWLYEQEK